MTQSGGEYQINSANIVFMKKVALGFRCLYILLGLSFLALYSIFMQLFQLKIYYRIKSIQNKERVLSASWVVSFLKIPK